MRRYVVHTTGILHILLIIARHQLNRVVMSVIFIIPLTCIALYESTRDSNKGHWVDNWFRGDNEGSQDSPSNRDPVVDDENGLQISKVPFSELIRVFPVVTQVGDTFYR